MDLLLANTHTIITDTRTSKVLIPGANMGFQRMRVVGRFPDAKRINLTASFGVRSEREETKGSLSLILRT